MQKWRSGSIFLKSAIIQQGTSREAIRVEWPKNTTTESDYINSYTLGVVRITYMSRTRTRRKRRPDRRNDVGDETGSRNMAVITAIGESTRSPRSTPIPNRFFGLHFRWKKYWCIFNHFYVICPESYRIWWNYVAVRAITFKVMQGHQLWYQSKAHMRLPISDL